MFIHKYTNIHICDIGVQSLSLVVFGFYIESYSQSINQNLYSAFSRSLLRGAPDLGQALKNSLEKVVELRTGTVWEMT